MFDGCIAAYNADDGWDLFAKLDTGSIGAVTIQNSLAFKNGYVLGDSGHEINAGNGNGFKMGGSNLPGGHMLINSVSFGNKAKGFDSNSCPDIKVYDSTNFDNESYNVALYTNTDETTGYAAQGIISYKKTNTIAENIKPRGSQTEDSLRGNSNYYFNGTKSVNSAGTEVTDEWFVSLDMEVAINSTIRRNEDGTINMGGFLELTGKAPSDAGARFTGDQTTEDRGESGSTPKPEEPSNPSNPSTPPTPSTPSAPSAPGSGVTTDTTMQNGGNTTETTAKPSASVSGDSASSSVSGSMGSEIVDQAEKNKSDSVVIAPDMPGNVTKADVTIPGSTLSQLGEKTDADVTVKTPAGSVTIPNEALEDLGKSGSSVTVSVENKVDNNTTSVDVKVDGKSVGTVPGGVKAALPVKDGQVAVLVDADGNETIIQKSLVEDGTAYMMLDGSATVKIVDNRKTFDDVNSSSWYSDAVTFASSHELFGGTGDGIFSPDSDMTRAMLATVLWRLESEAEAGQGAVDFADAVSGSWYADGVAWASAEGIVQGTGGNNFSPDNSITREQLATMLYRYALNRGLDTGKRANLSGYTDGASVSSWAGDAMQWAVAVGLIQGKGDGVLDAGGTATRAEVATVLQRLVGLLVK